MNQPIVAAPLQIQLPPEIQSLQPGEIQTRESFQVHAFDRTSVQSGGESLASDCLDSFLNSRGVNYRVDMSSPLTGEAGCSRLSPYIAIGNISMRTIHQHLSARVAELKEQRKSGVAIEPTWLKSLSSFRSRLSWHCHFMQKLDCLLYTSPSPRDQRGSRMPSSA